MMRMLWGALVGYVFFLIVGLFLFFGILTFFGLERLIDSATYEVSWRWLIISLFLVGWLAGASGKIAAIIGNRGDAALVLCVVVAIQGLAMIPAPLEGPINFATLDGMNTFQLMSFIQFPEWYSYMLPLFAAAFVAYGGYVFAR
jgi:hypothetical protein